jgi:hypothetical protein
MEFYKVAERWGEQGKPMGPVRLKEAETSAHIDRMCKTIFQNLKLYLDRSTLDPAERFQLQEIVLVNALARHIVSLERVVHWQAAGFQTLEAYQTAYFQSIGSHLEMSVKHLRGNSSNG